MVRALSLEESLHANLKSLMLITRKWAKTEGEATVCWKHRKKHSYCLSWINWCGGQTCDYAWQSAALKEEDGKNIYI